LPMPQDNLNQVSVSRYLLDTTLEHCEKSGLASILFT
jgi:hypothetical protein